MLKRFSRVRILASALGLRCVLLPCHGVFAQGRPLGPWRLTYRTVTEATISDWNGPLPGKKAAKLLPNPLQWDVGPDSVRLFFHCENPFIAPAQPRKGRPAVRFAATGATVRVDVKTKRLLIVPSSAVVMLWAYQGPKVVFKHVFKVISPPAPTLECYYGGQQPTDLKPGEKWQRALTLKAIPDASFSAFMPDDARYRVSLYQVTFLRNNRPIQPTQTIRGPQSSIGNPKDFQVGDQLRVQVQAVQRLNFRGDVEVLPVHQLFTLPVQFITY